MASATVVINAGSSSIKFSLFAVRGGDLTPDVRGQIEALYTAPHFVAKDPTGRQQLVGVGHRVVHGGRDYTVPVRVDAGVLKDLERLVPLAPLHQPHNLSPIALLLKRIPDLPQVACFDTSSTGPTPMSRNDSRCPLTSTRPVDRHAALGAIVDDPGELYGRGT